VWRAQRRSGDEGTIRCILADIHRRLGDLDAAEREARAALDLVTLVPLEQRAAKAMLAAILLARGHTAEARAAAEYAMQRLSTLRAFGYRGAFVHLVHAEALDAAGEHAEAAAVLAAARDRMLAQAEKIPDPEMRRRFLEDIPVHARIRELTALGARLADRDAPTAGLRKPA
jgi:ATP/maltotriose-dependent transcriptional regulator MalT